MKAPSTNDPEANRVYAELARQASRARRASAAEAQPEAKPKTKLDAAIYVDADGEMIVSWPSPGF